MNIVLSNKHTNGMKKLPLFLSVLLALGAGAFAGCQTESGNANGEPDGQIQQRTEEEPAPDGEKCPECRPRVNLRHRKGYAVGYGKKFDGGEFFIIQFGNGEPEIPDFPELPELPAMPDNG